MGAGAGAGASASASARANAVAPSAASASPAAPSGTTGTITVAPSHGGHRVYVDSQVIGESPGTFKVRCGFHSVRVGSQGTTRSLSVPCGGDVAAQ